MSSVKAEFNNFLETPKVCPNTSFESFYSSLNDKNSSNNQVCYKKKQQNFVTTLFYLQKSENLIWCNEYSNDILASLKESEKRRRKIDYKSRQTSHRPILLMLMEIAASRLSLSRTTLHLGVYLLDGFMDTYTISLEKLNASALMCLLIAAKIEEADLNIPKFAQLNDLVGGVYSNQDFKVVEKKIISTFEYDFLYPTAAAFVESYSNQLISYQDYLCHQIHRSNTRSSVFSTYDLMMQDSTEVLFNVLDISLHDKRLVNYTPSVVGAACLAATRSIKKIQPVWTERLIQLTGYNFEKIEPYAEVLELLYLSHHAQKPENICDSPDSGIASDRKSDSDSEEDDYDVVEYHPAVKRRRIFE
ncbi:cyclin-J isoform X2 [Episyrphus balteatus]|uniref:cyclin-J isoform X2 n=1 Tax=Episyrphus balteatus TaxID=286459 RepID=UPI002485FD2F|nr:cyclin-J isoform X2 [Episyrphus balteatus]